MEKEIITNEFLKENTKRILLFQTDSFNIVISKIKNEMNPDYPFFVFLENEFSMQKFISEKSIYLNLETCPILYITKEKPKEIQIDVPLLHKIAKTFEFPRFSVENLDVNVKLYYFLLFKLIFSLGNILQLLPYKSLEKKKKRRLPSSSSSRGNSSMRTKSKTSSSASPTRTSSSSSAPLQEISVRPASSTVVPPVFYITCPFDTSKYDRFVERNLVKIYQDEIKFSPYVQSFIKNIFNIPNFIHPSFQKNIQRDIEIIHSLLRKNQNEKEDCKSNIEKSSKIHQEFLQLPPKEFSETTYDGRVIQIHYRTEKSTGIFFNELFMNPELCIAKYKTFYKFHDSFQSNFSYNVSKDDNNLYIFRKEKNGSVLPHCIIKDTTDGVIMEILVLATSYYNSVERILFFIDNSFLETNIISTKKIGLIGKFEYINASFQYFLLADMIMNNLFFTPFLLLNDSDRISRDNKSIYMYFRSELETVQLSESLGVGGWTKDQSRFGHLTASLYPYKKNEKEYFITVKIHRAQNEKVLEQFKFIFARLLSLYEKEKNKCLKYFQKYYPQIELEPIETKAISSKAGSLGYENSIVFPGEYVRCCQRNRKPVLLKSIEDVEALQLPAAEMEYRILKFPKEPFDFEDTIIEPAYYFASNPNEPYMGYVKMKNLKKPHPFGGYVPCTFTRSQKVKNSRVEKELYENTIVEKKRKNTILYHAKKKKIIANTGQIGDLPKELVDFFYTLLPNYSFVHVGISDSLVHSSLFMACYYAIHKTLKDVPKDFRKDILDKNLWQTSAQENCIVGLSYIQNILQSDTATMEINHFFTTIERYFKIRLIVINYEGNFITPNSCYNYHYVDFPNDPFIILLEHETPQFRYEIVGYQDDNNGLQLIHKKDSTLFDDLCFIRKEYLKTYVRNDIIQPISASDYQSMFFNIPLFRQILNKSGQTQILSSKINSIHIAFFLEKPLPPFPLPVIESSDSLPPEDKVFEFLVSNIFTVKSLVYLSDKLGYFRLKHYPICIPFERSLSTSPKKIKKEAFHPLQFYFSPTENEFEKILYMFILSLLIKNYLLYKFKANELIKDFESSTIDYCQKSSFSKKQLSPLINHNEWIYDDSGGKIKVPSELRNTIQYFLEWNQILNKQELKAWKKKKELDFYQFSTQFETKFGNSVQTSSEIIPNVVYQNYHVFTNIKDLPSPLESDKIYYRFDDEKEIFHQFFLHPISKNHSKVLEKEKLVSILENYFEYGVFSWSISNHFEKPTFSEKYKIYEENDFFLCFFDFA